MLASDVMTTPFTTLKPDATIADAGNRFPAASHEQGEKVFGLILTDDAGRLVGMRSIDDLPLLVQPRHANIWQEMADASQARIRSDLLDRMKLI